VKEWAAVTVAHNGVAVRAHVYKLAAGAWWWMAWRYDGSNAPSGVLGDEGIHYVRGFLLNWWPPHRKRRDALLTAAALADPPPAPTPPHVPMAPAVLNIHSRLFDQLFGDAMKKLTGDANKLIENAERLGLKTRGTTTVTVNGRRNER